MNRQRRRRGRGRERHFRVEAIPKQSPDLHKLAQVFLGMAVTRAEHDPRIDGEAPADPCSGSGSDGDCELE